MSPMMPIETARVVDDALRVVVGTVKEIVAEEFPCFYYDRDPEMEPPEVGAEFPTEERGSHLRLVTADQLAAGHLPWLAQRADAVEVPVHAFDAPAVVFLCPH